MTARARQKIVVTGVLIGVIGLSVATGCMAGTPTEVVRNTVDAVVEVLADSGLEETAKRARVVELIAAQFAFDDMGRRILATNWKSASDEQKTRFVELFREILANTYWIRIKDYSDQRVDYRGEKIKNDDLARVRTVILTGKQEIPVDYSLKHYDSGWQAYDVTIEGVSLVRNYRSSYQQIARQEGIDGLLQRMAEKVASAGGS